MKNIILSFRILKKHWFLHLMICLEIAFSLYMLSTLFNRIEHEQAVTRIVDRASIEKTLYFMGEDTMTEDGDLIHDTSFQQAAKKVAGMQDFVGVSNIQEFCVNEGMFGINFDIETAGRFRSTLKSGSWFTDIQVENGRIPCVIVDTSQGADKYKVGDVITGPCTVYDMYNDIDISTEQAVAFEVTGVVDRSNAFVISPQGMTSNYTFPISQLFPGVQPEQIILLCSGLDDEYITSIDNTSGLIYFDEDMNQAEFKQIAEDLREIGYVEKVSELRTAEHEQLQYRLKMDLPLFLSFLSISLIGLISITLLNAKKQIKVFSIYYLCGCRWKRSIWIYMIYFSSLVVIAFIVYIIGMSVSYSADKIGKYYMYQLTSRGVLASLAVCLLFSIISTLIPFFNIKKNSLTEIRKVD